ncbi:hypothetical protein [Methylocystis bryophila]|uniref:Uncharacterized protein n=1 Tax=Methylocystis bryophila TaxID=655015 RepID=A0A1W6MSU0_9HYPH|nr:hypothetical protein [Methylocystis bryophila]ARN80681.1 hypothetical protein B1812_05890 [Methylocystis bryophila]BDV40747.1 hypothetical protein DSM21852_40000 [Methylocystis bryophila]
MMLKRRIERLEQTTLAAIDIAGELTARLALMRRDPARARREADARWAQVRQDYDAGMLSAQARELFERAYLVRLK